MSKKNKPLKTESFRAGSIEELFQMISGKVPGMDPTQTKALHFTSGGKRLLAAGQAAIDAMKAELEKDNPEARAGDENVVYCTKCIVRALGVAVTLALFDYARGDGKKETRARSANEMANEAIEKLVTTKDMILFSHAAAMSRRATDGKNADVGDLFTFDVTIER